jgi:response regulator RpfG family c-di-GMP phosphodiesterase
MSANPSMTSVRADAAKSARATVLFVDDEERVVSLLRVMFLGTYNVLTATSGQEALQILSKRAVHVIVSDQRMPGIAGIELLSRVRELAPNTVRILLTGYADLAAMVGSINEGAVYRFINKPWDNEDLREVIREAADIALSTGVVEGADPMKAQAQSTAPNAPVGFLILDDNEQDRAWFQDKFGPHYPVFSAADIPEAISILEKQEVGVIVTDSHVRGADTLQLLRALKRHHPMIMIVILTRSADSEVVLKLINEARVCRVTFKPLRYGPVDLALKAALRQHQIYRIAPNLLQQQRPLQTAAETERSGLAPSFMQRLRSLRTRLSW